MWAQIAQAAAAAAKAAYEYVQGKAEDAERSRLQKEMIDAVLDVGNRVLDVMLEANAAELRGDFEALHEDYLTYDADPDDPIEEARLASIIERSSNLMARLGGHIESLLKSDGIADGVGESAVRDLALQCAAMYPPMLYLRTQALAERQYTYGARELKDVSRVFHPAISRFERLGKYLEHESNARFGPIRVVGVDADSGRELFAYSFGNRSVSCGRKGMPVPFSKAARDRKAHMEKALKSYLGGVAPALIAAVEGMQRIVLELELPGRDRLRRPGDLAQPPLERVVHETDNEGSR